MLSYLFSNNLISFTSFNTQTKLATYLHQKEELPVLQLEINFVDPRC
jgi:hypothetical protein